MSHVRKLRKQYNLSVIQMAKALEVAPSMIGDFERGAENPPSPKALRDAVDRYCRGSIDEDNNLVFSVYPIGVARSLLRLSPEEAAIKYGYTAGTWQKFEANIRVLPADIREKLEREIRRELRKLAII